MDLLLDTHVFLWALSAPHKLPPQSRAAIEDSRNGVFISAAVTWEIAIKFGMGKLPLPMAPSQYLPNRIHQFGFKELPVTMRHTFAVTTLPRYHRDPFDRLLVAQAQVEGLTLVTVDEKMRAYAVTLLSS